MWQILIVDDNKSNQELLVNILKDKAVCTTAVNGKEALMAYNQALKQKQAFQVILLDFAIYISLKEVVDENSQRLEGCPRMNFLSRSALRSSKKSSTYTCTPAVFCRVAPCSEQKSYSRTAS